MEKIADLVGPYAAILANPAVLATVALATLVVFSGLAARIIEGLEAAGPLVWRRRPRPGPATAPSSTGRPVPSQRVGQGHVVGGRVGSERGLELVV